MDSFFAVIVATEFQLGKINGAGSGLDKGVVVCLKKVLLHALVRFLLRGRAFK